MGEGVDPSFAAWYAEHIMRAREAHLTNEMRAVRRERLKKEEARKTWFRRWFVINGVEMFLAAMRFVALSTFFILQFIVFWLAIFIICAWAWVFFMPFARVACYHHALPHVDTCDVSEWRIPDTNVTLGASHLYEIYAAFKTINGVISLYVDLDGICTHVYAGYAMNFTQIKMEQAI